MQICYSIFTVNKQHDTKGEKDMLLEKESEKIKQWLDAQVDIHIKRNLLENVVVDSTELGTCFSYATGIHLQDCIDKICEALEVEPTVKLDYIKNQYDQLSIVYKGVTFFELKDIEMVRKDAIETDV